VDTVVRAGAASEGGRRRIERVTRLRADARRYQPVVKPQAKGRPPKWGPRLAAPRHHVSWPVGSQAGRAWGYGRLRRFPYTQLRCRWAGSGPVIPVHVFVGAREGSQVPWFLVTTALDRTAAPVGEVCTARVRHEDAFRDQKQRLGMEACRAWTKAPRLRTLQVPLVALTLLRLRQSRLASAWGPGSWWSKPEWHRRKRQASILDLRRLFWRYRREFSHVLVPLENGANIPQPLARHRDRSGRAA
jgi:hypothetical protein